MNKNLMILALGCAAVLSGCSSVKKQVGLEKTVPDEFRVVKRAPLTQPPDYVLRPPRPGAPRPQEQTTSDQAAQAVFGNAPVADTSAITDGESALLNQAGSSIADPDIRQRVDSETEDLPEHKKPVAQRLLGIGGKDGDAATVVNAKEEAQRLKDNAEKGKPVTEGETPSIEQ